MVKETTSPPVDIISFEAAPIIPKNIGCLKDDSEGAQEVLYILYLRYKIVSVWAFTVAYMAKLIDFYIAIRPRRDGYRIV